MTFSWLDRALDSSMAAYYVIASYSAFCAQVSWWHFFAYGTTCLLTKASYQIHTTK